jgi:pilus assembly protein CpaE
MNAPWNPNRRGAVLREPFTAFVCDEETAEAIRPIAAEMGWSAERVNKGGLRNAVQALSVSASPQVLLVDLSDAGDPLSDINALAEVCEPGTIVIAAGVVNDVRLYRDFLASGIQDYLLKPLTPDALRDAFIAAQAALIGPKVHEPESDKPRVTVAVIGVRGGVGASTVAASLAWSLSDGAGQSTALLDLDIHFGTGALAFDLEPGRGLTDALENPGRIDGLFIERAMVRASDKLAVLSAEAPINQPLLADGGALHHLQEELRHAFETVVIDLPRGLAVQNPMLLADIGHVVVVTEQTLAATRDTIRVLGWLKSAAPGAQVTLVANRVTANPPPEVSRKDFEASVERRVDVVLPYDLKLAQAASKTGKCLAAAAKGTKLGAGFDSLVAAFADAATATVAPKSLVDKLVPKGWLSPRPKKA